MHRRFTPSNQPAKETDALRLRRGGLSREAARRLDAITEAYIAHDEGRNIEQVQSRNAQVATGQTAEMLAVVAASHVLLQQIVSASAESHYFNRGCGNFPD